MTSVAINKDTWTQVTTQTDYMVQNNSFDEIIEVQASAVTPTDDTESFFLKPFEGLDSNMPLTGYIWAKSRRKDSTVVVSE